LADGIEEGAIVSKGVTEFGNFYFGGSLNILLFTPIQGVKGSPMMASPHCADENGQPDRNLQYSFTSTNYKVDSGLTTGDRINGI